MSIWQKLFGPKVGKPKLSAVQGGQENPFTMTTYHRASEMGMAYLCPTCQAPVGLPLSQIDPVAGGRVLCEKCGIISHVPGAVRSVANDKSPTAEVTKVETVKVTAGVTVSISQFADWYHEHPLRKALYASGHADYHTHYGVWAFCDRCKHEYQHNLLATFTLAQHTKGFIFNAHSPKSQRDMNGLLSGACPECGSTKLIAILTEVPDYVATGIQEFQQRGT